MSDRKATKPVRLNTRLLHSVQAVMARLLQCVPASLLLFAQFVDDYRNVIDGVVAAYPQDREEILHARAILNGATFPLVGELCCPWNTSTSAGDFLSPGVPANLLSTNQVRFRFLERDDFSGATAGYRFKQVTINDAVVWEEDVAGGFTAWKPVEVNATRWVQEKTNAILSFRLFDKKGVSNFGVHWRVKDLNPEGMQLAANLDEPERWKVNSHGPFTAGFGRAMQGPHRSIHIPLILMTAGSADEFRLRHGEPATPQRIAEWLRLCLETWRGGRGEGVVTYCLDKRMNSQAFPLAQKLFEEFRAK